MPIPISTVPDKNSSAEWPHFKSSSFGLVSKKLTPMLITKKGEAIAEDDKVSLERSDSRNKAV